MDFFGAPSRKEKKSKKHKKEKSGKKQKKSKKERPGSSSTREQPDGSLMEQALRLQKKLAESRQSDAIPSKRSTPRAESSDGSATRKHSQLDTSEGSASAAGSAPASGSGSGGASGSEEPAKLPKIKSFAELGLCDPLVQSCTALGWKSPTPIQAAAIPHVLAGRDVVGLAETGSGKTAAFSLPMLQALLASPQRFFGLVLAPTRELALQIHDQLSRLGQGIGLSVVALVGGVDLMAQSIALARRPHVVVGTPGRVADHLENTKGFTASKLRFIVLDEADRMLSLDFEEALDKILAAAPSDRRTLLFSATITTQVARLQRASLRNPVKVEVSASEYQTVGKLTQEYIFVPAKIKDAHLVAILAERRSCSAIVFVATCALAQRAAGFLRVLGFPVACLHGHMSQPRRLQQLHDFRSGNKKVLVATDVASRGLDIPQVDLVINLDVPSSGKDYVHRVGRTARAGRSGRAVTVVTQYDVEQYKSIEAALGKKLTEYPKDDAAAAAYQPRVEEAARQAQAVARDAREALAHALDDGEGLEGAGPGRKRGRGAVPSKKERRREKMLAAAAEAAEFGGGADGGEGVDAGADELARSRKRRRKMVAAAMDSGR